MKLIYPAVFYPFSDKSGGYTVEVPDLPGCVTEGKDLSDHFCGIRKKKRQKKNMKWKKNKERKS